MKKYDIAIIGGGFAGASLAYKLSKLDSSLEIALIERNAVGCKPVSAFTFTDVIEDLDIRNSVMQYYNQIEIISTLGARESHAYDNDVFAFIDYKKACEELVERSGCQVIFDEVMSIKGGKLVLKGGMMDATVIADASGRGYKFRKEVGMDVPGIENHLYFKKLMNCSISNVKSLHLIVGNIGTNGGWFFPINNNECVVGFAERTDKLSRFEKKNISMKQKKNLEQLLADPFYGKMLGSSSTESEAMSCIPYEPVKRVVKGNVVFLGDNSGMVHPMHGMGLHYIDRIGTICADYCTKAVHSDVSILKGYQEEWDIMLRNDMDTWVMGMTYWNLNVNQLNKIIDIRSNSYVDGMNVLNELRGQNRSRGDVFKVPVRLYLALIKQALINKIKYKLKYRC